MHEAAEPLAIVDISVRKTHLADPVLAVIHPLTGAHKTTGCRETSPRNTPTGASTGTQNTISRTHARTQRGAGAPVLTTATVWHHWPAPKPWTTARCYPKRCTATLLPEEMHGHAANSPRHHIRYRPRTSSCPCRGTCPPPCRRVIRSSRSCRSCQLTSPPHRRMPTWRHGQQRQPEGLSETREETVRGAAARGGLGVLPSRGQTVTRAKRSQRVDRSTRPRRCVPTHHSPSYMLPSAHMYTPARCVQRNGARCLSDGGPAQQRLMLGVAWANHGAHMRHREEPQDEVLGGKGLGTPGAAAGAGRHGTRRACVCAHVYVCVGGGRGVGEREEGTCVPHPRAPAADTAPLPCFFLPFHCPLNKLPSDDSTCSRMPQILSAPRQLHRRRQ